jgi:hypothetical protein
MTRVRQCDDESATMRECDSAMKKKRKIIVYYLYKKDKRNIFIDRHQWFYCFVRCIIYYITNIVNKDCKNWFMVYAIFSFYTIWPADLTYGALGTHVY